MYPYKLYNTFIYIYICKLQLLFFFFFLEETIEDGVKKKKKQKIQKETRKVTN